MRLLPCCAPLLAAAALTGCADQMLSNDRAVSAASPGSSACSRRT